MPLFHAIAAMSENRVIGDKGKIPWHIADDFRWFKHKTMGGTLIMGRKTFESIGKPLPGRKTIVLTRQPLNIPGVEVVSDADQLIKQEAPEQTVAWVCGGAEIYRQLLPECLTVYLTRVKREVAGDVFLPTFETEFDLGQVIYENPEFRIERWYRKGRTHEIANEPWPFAQ